MNLREYSYKLFCNKLPEENLKIYFEYFVHNRYIRFGTGTVMHSSSTNNVIYISVLVDVESKPSHLETLMISKDGSNDVVIPC